MVTPVWTFTRYWLSGAETENPQRLRQGWRGEAWAGSSGDGAGHAGGARPFPPLCDYAACGDMATLWDDTQSRARPCPLSP